MATGPTVTFAQNGMVIQGKLNVSNLKRSAVSSNFVAGGTSFVAGGFVGKPAPPPRCGKRRGGPRSNIYCDIYKQVPHTHHFGQGLRKWYSWKDEDGQD